MPDRDKNNLNKALKIAALTVAIIAILYLVKPLAHVLMLVFAGILFSVFLSGIAEFFERKIKLPRGISITVSIIVIFSIPFLLIWIAGSSIADQAVKLTEFIEKAIQYNKEWLSQHEWGRRILSGASQPQQVIPIGSDILSSITGVFSSFFGALANFLIVFLLGIYFSNSPNVYINNIIKLFPKHRRPRIRNVVLELGQALQKWLIGRFASMLIIGVLVASTFWIIGLPLAGILGIIAAIVSFVPYVGPILGSIPAILVAIAEDPIMVVYVIIVYIIVQSLEGYVITPIIQMKAVSMPPALLITMQIIMGVLIGPVGVLLATPVAVTIIVIIQMLYIEDVLNDSVRILGRRF
jgi:predicted PurR-regulated permease PerM